MKILDRDLKHGTVKIMADTADDLWYLYTIIAKDDVCRGESEYKYKLGDSREGKSQIVKKRVIVAINVERLEFTTHLRITGKVVDGSEEVPRGSFHSLDVSEGTSMHIKKERWLPFQLEKLEEAVRSGQLDTLMVLFDREHAVFVKLKPTGHQVLLDLKGDVPKKGLDEARQHSFYKEIVKHLEEFVQRFGTDQVVAASPSFWKEYLEKELTADLRKKVIFAPVSTAETSAVPEVLRRPELQHALQSQRSTREAYIVDQILEMLAKDKMVYGMDDLKQAIAEGNLSELTVSENAIMLAREKDSFEGLEELMKAATDIKATVHLLSTDDAKQKIDPFGGVVGVKRW